MGDDGRGKTVHIPGVLISKSDGQVIKSYYKNNLEKIKENPILLEIDFEMETHEEVELDIYFESNDFNMLKVLKNLKIFLENLALSVNFAPRFLSFEHPFFNSTGNNNDFNSENCINKGRYCVWPRGLKNKKLNGMDVIRNNLYMKCAFLNDDSSTPFVLKEKFFDFIGFFVDDCLNYKEYDNDVNVNENYFSEKCMDDSLIKGGFDLKEIKDCLENSFLPKGSYLFIIFFIFF